MTALPELPDDLSLHQSLRDGLYALPVPEAGPDFDTRVLAALRAPAPWWQRLWQPARPLLLGASCSLTVTLLLLHWALSAPVTAPFPAAAPSASAAAPSGASSLDSLLDRPDLRAGSLAAAWAIPPPLPPPERRAEPPHHAQAGRRAALIA